MYADLRAVSRLTVEEEGGGGDRLIKDLEEEEEERVYSKILRGKPPSCRVAGQRSCVGGVDLSWLTISKE